MINPPICESGLSMDQLHAQTAKIQIPFYRIIEINPRAAAFDMLKKRTPLG